VDNGQVVAVTNPDYNVEKTVVISSGKQQHHQQEQGLNLSYRQQHHQDTTYLLAPHHQFNTRPQLDLSEWVGHRVLTRRGEGVYYPGVIAEVRPPPDNDLHILLDRTNESVIVKSPLADGGTNGSGPAVISDAIPMTSQVEIGAKVCVRQPRRGRSVDTFVEAVVYEVCRQPLQFLVKIGESDAHKIWVTRAALRLQEPPWLEELTAVADYPQETVSLASLSKLNRNYVRELLYGLLPIPGVEELYAELLRISISFLQTSREDYIRSRYKSKLTSNLKLELFSKLLKEYLNLL
jgi:hypothetical protein